MFSLYEIGDFLLAFYTDIPSGPFSAIEIVDSDDSIFEIGMFVELEVVIITVFCLFLFLTSFFSRYFLVADLRLMLQNIITK